MLNDDIIIALGLATAEDLANIREITLKINSIVKNFLKERGILFPDFKIEFGRDSEGNIVLGDEISPDTCVHFLVIERIDHMKYNAEVRISLKKGMLNPEAATIQRALALLDYKVENTDTIEIIKFSIEGEDEETAHAEQLNGQNGGFESGDTPRKC